MSTLAEALREVNPRREDKSGKPPENSEEAEKKPASRRRKSDSSGQNPDKLEEKPAEPQMSSVEIDDMLDEILNQSD
jgi:hypothetical protein